MHSAGKSDRDFENVAANQKMATELARSPHGYHGKKAITL